MVVSNNVKVLRPRTIKCQEWWISGNFAISQTKIWNFTDKPVLLLSAWKCVHVQCWCVAHFGLIMDIISVEENWVAGGSWSDEMERPRQWSNSFKRLQKCFCSSSRDEEPLPPPDTCYSFPWLLVQAYSIVVQETTGLNWFSMENGMSSSTYSFCSS